MDIKLIIQLSSQVHFFIKALAGVCRIISIIRLSTHVPVVLLEPVDALWFMLASGMNAQAQVVGQLRTGLPGCGMATASEVAPAALISCVTFTFHLSLRTSRPAAPLLCLTPLCDAATRARLKAPDASSPTINIPSKHRATLPVATTPPPPHRVSSRGDARPTQGLRRLELATTIPPRTCAHTTPLPAHSP